MKKKEFLLISLFFGLILFVGCNKTGISSSDKTTVLNLISDWDKAHSSKDVAVFSTLYGDTVVYYGTTSDKNTCISDKLTFFKRNPDFYQQIYGDILTEDFSNDEVKCSFVKRVTKSEKTSDFPSYLILKKIDNTWKIIVEGDLVTDKNIAKKNTTSENIKIDYEYEPVVSSLTGTLMIETYFGPPGYGENPQEDSREDSYILTLNHSINVISDKKEIEEGDFNQTKYNISKIQLTSTNDVNLHNFVNKKICLEGTFFGASSGHHHTDVLLDVQKIKEIKE